MDTTGHNARTMLVGALAGALLLTGAVATSANAAEVQASEVVRDLLVEAVHNGAEAIKGLPKDALRKASEYLSRGQLLNSSTTGVSQKLLASSTLIYQQQVQAERAAADTMIQRDTPTLVRDAACDQAWARMRGDEQAAVTTLISQGSLQPVQLTVVPQNGETVAAAITQHEYQQASNSSLAGVWTDEQWNQYGNEIANQGLDQIDGGNLETLNDMIVLPNGTIITPALFYYAGACLQP